MVVLNVVYNDPDLVIMTRYIKPFCFGKNKLPLCILINSKLKYTIRFCHWMYLKHEFRKI